jgi:hypothetical protein
MLVPVLGYMPDVDPTTLGALTNCSALVPSTKGMKGAPSAQDVSLVALDAACQGAAVLRKLDDSTRFFAGTGTKLQEASGSAWTDRTRASGGAYGVGSDQRWTFAQFGNVSLAVAKTDILQASTTGAFSNAASDAPKASIVETVGQFVFLFDVNDQGGIFDSTDRPDGWWCAQISSYTAWAPSIANQSATGRLTSSPGRIVGGRRFGQAIIAYKQRSMYLGQYVEAPEIWQFNQIPGEVGALSHEAIVNVGTPEQPRHIFMGFDDFYSFDGSVPVPVGSPLKETVYGELNKEFSFAAKALHDVINSRIYFYYPVASSVNPDKCVVLNYKTMKWGRDDRSIEAVVEYISQSLTYDDLGNEFSTYEDLTGISYDSFFWMAGFPIAGVFNTSHRIQTLDGQAGTPSLTTGDFGDDMVMGMLSRVKPLFITAPSSATQTNYYRQQSLGDSLTTDQTVSMSNGRFDAMRSARWHRVRHDYVGDMELVGLNVVLEKDSEE